MSYEPPINVSYFSFPGVGGSWLDPLHSGRLPAGAAGGGQPKHNLKGQYGRDESPEGEPQAQEAHQLIPSNNLLWGT